MSSVVQNQYPSSSKRNKGTRPEEDTYAEARKNSISSLRYPIQRGRAIGLWEPRNRLKRCLGIDWAARAGAK